LRRFVCGVVRAALVHLSLESWLESAAEVESSECRRAGDLGDCAGIGVRGEKKWVSELCRGGG
jgi:hypothetical protein